MDSRGLLQAAGLEELDVHAEERRKHGEKELVANRLRKLPGEDEAPAPRGWYQRWQRYRAEREKRRTPGVTVVYFSLAALPLFGLGQSLIPAAAGDRRRYVFWLMTVYVGSGLGLLLTTSFLGLRRYLNQRKLKMPPAMTAVWLSVGGGLVAVLLLLGALLPRPSAEYPLFDFNPAGSEKESASKHAVKGDSPGKGPGRANSGKDGKEDDAENKDKDAGKGKDKDAGKDKDGEKGGDKDKGKSGQDGKDKDGKDKDGKGKEKDGEKDAGSSRDSDSVDASTDSVASTVSEFFRQVTPVLKWIVFGIIALIFLVIVLRSGLRWLANFFEWARNLLDALRNLFSGLFGGWVGGGSEETEETATKKVTPPRPFAAFSNPFTDGSARGRSPRELVRYTFAAFEAWAREHHLGREAGETPLEFAQRVGEEMPKLEDDSRRLADLFAKAVYSADELSAAAAASLRETWELLEETARVSATA